MVPETTAALHPAIWRHEARHRWPQNPNQGKLKLPCKTCKLSSARNSVNSQISKILSDHKWFYSNNFSSLNQHLRRTSLELINGTDLDVANKGTVCSVGRGRENCFKLFLKACSPEKEINYFIQYDVKNTLKLFSYHNYSSEMGKYLFFKWW